MNLEKLRMLENMLKTVDPQELGVAFHNTFVHGENITAHGYFISDEKLGQLFEHLDGITEILGKLND
jgi:hypothetical protein